MNMKTIVKLTLLYLVCFVSSILLLIHELTVRSLSPRFALPIFLVVAYGLTVVFVHVTFRKNRAVRSFEVSAASPIDSATVKRRVYAIRAGRVMIALLVVGLLTGLTRAKTFPVWETLVAVAINLLITVSMVRLVMRLQKSLM